MKSILHKVTRADVVAEPFPHVVVDDALPADLYAALAETFPFPEVPEPENNTAYRTPAAHLLADPAVAPVWKEFAAYHTSAEFFAEAVSLFEPLSRFASARTTVRYAGDAEVALDCQPCWGSPVTAPSTSDACHLDREITLFGGLLYCKLAGDDAVGGDLELYRFRGEKRDLDETRHADPAQVEPVKRIEYGANRLVFFLQSPEALHGVTVRGVTRWPRLHVNFLAEVAA